MTRTHRIGRAALLWSCAFVVSTHLTTVAATLTNRYSFNDEADSTNVVDSVGGPFWNGILPAGGYYDGSQLTLAAAAQQFVSLPPGIISNYTAVTIDAWATFGTLPVNCFFYGFGNTDVAGSDPVGLGWDGYGYRYLFCAPQAGRIAITDAAWAREQQASGGGNWSGQTVHVTAVYNPPQGCIALYKNGALVQMNLAETLPISAVMCVSNYIGKSLYTGDPWPDLQLNEFRIYNGALNSLEVAGSEVAGPDALGTAADAGDVTGIDLSVPFYQLIKGNSEQAKVLGTATAVAYTVDMTLMCDYTSGNTNILTVNANGKITAVAEGSTTITAQYGGRTSAKTITVGQPASVLGHRYSFSEADGSGTVADSKGGAAWAGTLPAGGTFSSGQLSLAAGQYVELPAGLITNYQGLTVEAWATFPSALPTTGWLFGFGDTDENGDGANFVYLHPQAGRISIGCGDPGDRFEDQASGLGDLSLKTNVHLSAVFNPAAGWIAVYANGALVGKKTAFAYPQAMNLLGSAVNYIAKSLYTANATIDVDLNEFRIYNGALTSQGIAISDLAGPNSIPSTVTNGVGALLSFAVQVPASVEQFGSGQLKLLGTYNGLTNWDMAANSVFPPTGLVVSSSNTNVATCNANGLIRGLSPGTTTLTVIYQGVTNSALLTVARPVATLTHRYSFTADASDSVGGSAWEGTLPNGGTFAGGQVALDKASAQYVQLPAGIISNYNAVTIETWATSAADTEWACFIYGFGDTDTGANLGRYYIFGSFSRNYAAITDDTYNREQGIAGSPGWAPGLNGRTNLHWTAVYNPPAGYIAIYTNGVLEAINDTSVTIPLSSTACVLNYIGKSLYPNDPAINLSVDEFRIYSGALSPTDIAAHYTWGPDNLTSPSVTLGAALSAGSVVLSWPASATAQLQSRASLTTGDWADVTTPAPQLVGDRWTVSLSTSGDPRFFRLKQ